MSLKKGNERSERLEAPGGTRERKCKYTCLHSKTVARDTQRSSTQTAEPPSLSDIKRSTERPSSECCYCVRDNKAPNEKNALKFKSHLKRICGTEMSRLCGEVTLCTRGFKGFCLIFIFLLQIIHLSMNQSIFLRKAQSFPQICSHFRCGQIHIRFSLVSISCSCGLSLRFVDKKKHI